MIQLYLYQCVFAKQNKCHFKDCMHYNIHEWARESDHGKNRDEKRCEVIHFEQYGEPKALYFEKDRHENCPLIKHIKNCKCKCHKVGWTQMQDCSCGCQNLQCQDISPKEYLDWQCKDRDDKIETLEKEIKDLKEKYDSHFHNQYSPPQQHKLVVGQA